MGIKISFLVKDTPVRYKKNSEFDATGKEHNDDLKSTKGNEFERVTQAFFKKVIAHRRDLQAARKKFVDFNPQKLLQKFPFWDVERILDLKSQFLMFDLNQDGLIDFEELCQVLDDMGDTSSVVLRRSYFDKIDKDKSNTVDFEEFNELIYRVQFGECGCIGEACKRTADQTTKIRKMAIIQQIQHGLF